MAGNGSIVIKKIKKGGGHGHHGGAWKVAYADFVTAMMAFFLLMWLINTTTPEQKRGIADYFAPSAVSKSDSGAGGVLGGTTPAQDGAKSAGSAAFVVKLKEAEDEAKKRRERDDAQGSGLRGRQQDSAGQRALDAASAQLRQAMQSDPDLAELSKHVLIDQTDDGMRIQLVDQDGRSMFEPGSVEPTPRVRRLLTEVAQSIGTLSNRVAISGHTDGQPFQGPGGYSSWDLSSARANAARRILEANGLQQNRIAQVSGKAGSDPLYPDNPFASANRRITIMLLREAPVLPPDLSP